jgi:hypothetical protein
LCAKKGFWHISNLEINNLKRIDEMRKILFATSALVGATAIASSALAGGTHAVEQAKPNAGALTVMVGGQIDFQAGFSGEAAPGQRSGRLSNDTEIHVQVSGSTDSFDYGAVIELNADIQLMLTMMAVTLIKLSSSLKMMVSVALNLVATLVLLRL